MAATLTREQKQDYGLQYNPMTLDELAAAYPAMDWPAYLTALGISGVDRVIVGDTGYLAALPAIMAETPVETLRAYLTLRLMMAWADALSEELGETAFALTRALSGLETPPPLEERVLEQVNGAVPDAVGKLYVAAYFPPEAKATMEALTQDVLAAFRRRLEANTWMTPATKAEALRKLAAVTVKVGYPDRWETYEAVALADSFAGSLRSALAMRLCGALRQGRPTGRSRQVDTTRPGRRRVLRPVRQRDLLPGQHPATALLRLRSRPGLQPWRHRLHHRPRDHARLRPRGSQFDGDGNLRDWWTAEDRERFLALNEALAAQYAAIEVAPGLFVNGQITVTENAADLGGIQNAYAALLAGLGEDETALAASPTTGATRPRSPSRRRSRRSSASSSPPRPPGASRSARRRWNCLSATTPTRPMWCAEPSRYATPTRSIAAFGIEPGDPMWLAPEERIVIW